MVIKKRCLLWDYTNTNDCPGQMDKVNFNGPISSVSNWNAWTPPELKGRAPFRPMIHLEHELSGDPWKWISESKEPIVVPTLRDQHHKKLVSPSYASDPAGQKWISEFISLVKDSLPDFLGLHWYGDSADEAQGYIDTMHKKFLNHKVIVPEIACISRNQKDCYAFTQKMCNWMDDQNFVFEYAFFGCMKNMPDDYVSPEARLMNPDGSFTDSMNKYMNAQPWN
ncbi:glycoside hydrolase family 128 protein [Lophiostoma macrostomum CBS 122681]|uniref:Glycoside hydrolase family 128 protein n=1 Tax=Lophiostoma macrostomum CBS 122681 TaxID=1314788 RepID=A0A6A6T294_9PLEO|nr:glycoside hydrolase family 128 protein [Lophiostoma macrostomum CBS 122681]